MVEERILAHDTRPKLAWARFWGRHIDLLVTQLIVLAAVILVNPKLVTYGSVVAIATFPIAMFLIALTRAAFGATLGNVIVGVRVKHVSGERITLTEAIKREARVYLFGLALGLPIIGLFAMVHQYSELRMFGSAGYDRKLGLEVVSQGSNPVRTWFVCLAFVIVPMVFLAFRLMVRSGV